jgi:hypothetical protein
MSIADSTGLSCPLGSEAINRIFELTVDASPSLLPVKVNSFIRFYGRPFENSAFPCVIGPGWQGQSESLADLYGCGGKEPTGSLLANDSGQIVFSRKRNDHFRCTRGMAIYEEAHPSVKCLISQFFRLRDDWPLRQH